MRLIGPMDLFGEAAGYEVVQIWTVESYFHIIDIVQLPKSMEQVV